MKIAGVVAVEVARHMGDGVRFVGAGDEVVMVGHQAVGEYVDVVRGGGAGE